MGKILVILNHKPLDEQLEELRELGYDEVEFAKHPLIPADAEMPHVASIFSAHINGREFDALWIQGDFRFFAVALEYCKVTGKPLYVATTERKAVEQVMPDGSVVKKSIFKHVKFVRVV